LTSKGKSLKPWGATLAKFFLKKLKKKQNLQQEMVKKMESMKIRTSAVFSAREKVSSCSVIA